MGFALPFLPVGLTTPPPGPSGLPADPFPPPPPAVSSPAPPPPAPGCFGCQQQHSEPLLFPSPPAASSFPLPVGDPVGFADGRFCGVPLASVCVMKAASGEAGSLPPTPLDLVG